MTPTTELTREEKRVKIAEALGIPWIDYVYHRDADHAASRRKTHHLGGSLAGHSVTHEYCECGAWRDVNYPQVWNAADRDSDRPNTDYFADLNAAHEMEKSLSPHAQWVYLNHIANLVKPGSNSEQMQLFIPFATASQRAEAFGLTLGLWTASREEASK